MSAAVSKMCAALSVFALCTVFFPLAEGGVHHPGAVLDLSGASTFFIDLSFAAIRGSRSAPERTVTAAGFLLGTVLGSGTATAVSLGSVVWPWLRRATPTTTRRRPWSIRRVPRPCGCWAGSATWVRSGSVQTCSISTGFS
ncbi:TRAP transporter large permease subunit [Streptomyces sp. NPDC056254]|uniref:TRAP transporter large permease subunit n=1 Tax=Streptomyces sp. NPDC056254 TaxID=3345763 RepID=UPI0035D5ABF7